MLTKTRTIACAVALLAGMALASCYPLQQMIPPGPPDLTIRAAPGAPGEPRDMAEEFLKHSPFAAGNRFLLHEDLCYAEPFYYDAGLDPAGKDTDPFNGVDTETLFFNATHGTPRAWLAMPNGRDPAKCPQSASETHAVEPGSLWLGNGRGTGNGLRYFWQCASSVLAHGPRQCRAPAPEFGCPEGFDGTQDTVLMGNVYERWGGMFAPGLRMVCGFSTAAFCHPEDARRVWDLYSRSSNGYAVADAFIEGFLQGREGTVPLCITLGSAGVDRTPFSDEALTPSPNLSGTSHYHAQYPVRFSSASSPLRPTNMDFPRWAPIYGLKPMQLPATLKNVAFEKQDDLLVSRDLEGAAGFAVRIHPASGAVYLNGAMSFDPDDPPLAEDQYLESAFRFLHKMGLAEAAATPEGIHMMLESVPVVNRTYDVTRRQKNVVLTFRRQVELDGKLFPVLGDGGLIRLKMNNDGSIARAVKIWREITGVRKVARVKPYETAYGEALQHLANPGDYTLDGWSWGYKESEGTAEQGDLKIILLFYFVPKAGDSGLQVSPARVEIAAQLDMTEATIDK